MNSTATPVRLPKFMIVASASKASNYITHEHGDEPCKMSSAGHVLMQCYSTNTVIAVHYKPAERQHKQVDRPNSVKKSDNNEKADWQNDLMVHGEYFAYCDKFLSMIEQLESM